MRTPRFLAAFALGAAAILSMIAAVNIAIDVRGIYKDRQSFVVEYVQRLLRSPHGLVAVPLERAVKLELARVARAGCFVIGSSRAMLFGQAQLRALGHDCPSVANLAVSGAGFEDMVASAGRLVGKVDGATIFIGIDPWAFRYNSDVRYKEFAQAYRQGRARLGLGDAALDEGGLDKLANLINGQYWLRNVTHGISGDAGLAVIEVAEGGANMGDASNITNPDGSQTYSRSYLNAPPPPEAKVGNGSAKIAHPYVDSHLAEEFGALLSRLQAQGARVVLLLAPYHPKVFACGSVKACEALAEVERWIRALAARHRLSVIGGFDPRPLGLGPQFFRDDLHMDVSAIAHLRAEAPGGEGLDLSGPP